MSWQRDVTRFYFYDKGTAAFNRNYVELSREVERLCQGTIEESYLVDEKPNTDLLLIVRGPRRIKGFAMLRRYQDRYYVILMCSDSGVGRDMMQHVISRARDEGLAAVSLAALPQVINYYRNKLGFALSEDCFEAPRISAEANAVSDRVFRDMDSALEDPQFSQLIGVLLEENLNYKKNCDKADVEECAKWGFTMTLCLAPAAAALPKVVPLPVPEVPPEQLLESIIESERQTAPGPTRRRRRRITTDFYRP